MLPEQQVLECARRSMATLNAALGRDDPLPRLRFDLRGRCAGQARLQDWSVRLNLSLLLRHGEAFIEQTVPHEIAHLVAHALHGPGIRPHGPQWRAVMALLKAPAQVCHSYATAPARRVKQYDYVCPCRPHRLGSVRHRRARAGQRYLCRRCGGVLSAASEKVTPNQRLDNVSANLA